MSYCAKNYRKYEFLVLTVLECFGDSGVVHEHCKQQVIDLTGLTHPRLLAKHLLANSEVLQNRKHRLYYAVPLRTGTTTILSLDDYVAFEVFFQWFRRKVNDVYAVVGNGTIVELRKVVTLYVKQIPCTVDTDRAGRFKDTVAKPFSHQPAEPEVDFPDDRFYSQLSSHDDNHVTDGRGLKNLSRASNKHNRSK